MHSFFKFAPLLWCLQLAIPTSAQAMSITDAYTLALKNDPTWRASVHGKAAGDEYEKIGLAALLPDISLSYQNAPHNTQKQRYQQQVNGQKKAITTHNQYSSSAGSITLSQPLFDYEAYSRYKLGSTQKQIAEENYRSELQDLARRVVDAYLNTAYAREKRALAISKRSALQTQLTHNKKLLDAGEGTLTDVAETTARYHLANADVIAVSDELEAAQKTLEAITGTPFSGGKLNAFSPGQRLTLPLKFSTLKEWQQMAATRNPELQAAHYEVEAKRYEQERNRGAALPDIYLYASHSMNNSASDSTINQRYDTDSIGIRVNVPIYTGGKASASVRQATAQYAQAKELMQAQHKKIENDLHNYFNQCTHSPLRLEAYSAAVESAKIQVDATRKGIAGGQRVNIDLLNAEQQLYQAQLNLTDAIYLYMRSWVNLQTQAGIFSKEDLLMLSRYLTQ